jgi:hypothetical protein
VNEGFDVRGRNAGLRESVESEFPPNWIQRTKKEISTDHQCKFSNWDVAYEGIQTFLSPFPSQKPINNNEQTKQQGVLLLFTEMS